MTYLLDTHILLWALVSPASLTAKTRERIRDPHHAIFVSAASVWEIAIKKALGKLKAPDQLAEVLSKSRFSALPVTWAHAIAVEELPVLHKDPFDRILVAQAKIEGLTLLTHDRLLKAYGSFVQLV